MRIHVLILSPSRDKAEALCDKLPHGYHVHTAKNSPQESSVFDRYPIHVVLCVEGPGAGSGGELCRQVKNNPRSAHLPVILVTPEDNLTARVRSLEAGADVHIGGPVFREHLDLQIRNLVANRNKVHRHLADSVATQGKQAMKARQAILHQLDACKPMLLHEKKIDVNQLARLMHMSRPTLYRKLKGVINLTPHELINETRLQKAAMMLSNGEYRAFEVARILGYTSQSSFGKSFLKQYKVTPATYQRMQMFAAQYGNQSIKTTA